ncbi:MAG: DNA polymerase IV [Chthoniobacterales bacterium]
MIIHLDADAFFVSVEQALNPSLKGRPVAVGGGHRGIIASASYEARQLGIYTPMPVVCARKQCPELIVLPGDFKKYRHFSKAMFAFAFEYTPIVEVCSIDEGYFDVRGNHFYSAVEIAERIRNSIRRSLDISVSIGVASNKLIASVASKIKKPGAFITVSPGEEKKFLAPLDSKWLPGVGPKMRQHLETVGLTKIQYIAQLSSRELTRFFGKQAEKLRQLAQGIDTRPVIPETSEAKSCSHQETFDSDVKDRKWILAKLFSITDFLLAKIRKKQKVARTIEVRLRYYDFQESRQSESLSKPSNLEKDFYPILRRLLKKTWTRPADLRLVCVRLSNFHPLPLQTEFLFCEKNLNQVLHQHLAVVRDKLKEKHGEDACLREHDLYLKNADI